MREFEALVNTAKDYCVLAYNIAFANRLDRYFILALLARFQNLSESFGRAARRILFHFVMCLDDLGIEVRNE